MLVAMPDAFMRKHSGFELPAQGDYAVAMCFLPQEEANADRARKSLERASRQRGLGVLGWRVLETDNSDLGEAPLASEPRVEQLFLTKKQGWDSRKFDQELYRRPGRGPIGKLPDHGRRRGWGRRGALHQLHVRSQRPVAFLR